MSQGETIDLKKLGRDAAQHVAGLGIATLVDVVSDEDFLDRPVYRFSYTLDENIDWQRAGLVRTRLNQRLRDGLSALGKNHYPVIQILSRADLDKRASA